MPVAALMPLAHMTPETTPPINPGPAVTATASISLNPTFAAAHCGLGDSLAYEGRYDEALDRFEKAIDQAAMHAGLINSDDYLNEWRQTEWQERKGDPEAIAEELATQLEEAYPQQRLRAMARNGGYE